MHPYSRVLSRDARTAVAALLALAMLAAPGCMTTPAPEQRAVQHVVIQYNAALAEGFRRMDMNTLSSVATRDQAQTEYHQMAALGEGKVRLLATLVDIRFLSTKVDEDKAVAETEERWDYEQVSTEASETLRVEKGVVYRLRYELVRESGRWLVDRVKEIVDEGESRDPDRTGSPLR